MQRYDTDHLHHGLLNEEANWPAAAAFRAANLEQESDERLLELIKTGSRSQRKNAFAAIYNRYYLDIWRFIQSKGLSEADTEDVFCDVWEIALKKLPKFVWRGKSVKAWLITTANNKRLELIRRKQKENSIALNEDIHAQALRVIDAELQLDQAAAVENPPPPVRQEADKLLLQAISKLKPKPRKIIRLTYFNKKNSTEIGQMLGITPSAVRMAHSRALDKLRRLLNYVQESHYEW